MSNTYVDLSPVVRSINGLSDNLRVVHENVSIVDSKVEMVAQQQNATSQRLDQLYDEFLEFVAADIRAKHLQFAQTQIIEVRQMIEKEFGHYDEVRRVTTGILQATDAAIVRQETMRQATENLMLLVPGYWLAPAIVALGAWISNNRSLAEQALAEAVRRDDSKTSLFFALICRRAGRSEANVRWLHRYFQMQNPHGMDREVVVMLDALANGVFGGAALNACSEVVDKWLEELEEQAGFSDEQRARWMQALDALKSNAPDGSYPTLQKHSKTYADLLTSLRRAKRNRVVLSYFEQIFTGETSIPPNLASQVDGLLDSLVKNFDDEELPLRRKKRLLELTIEEHGDQTQAKHRYAAESDALEAQTNFAAMLTNAAMHPQDFGATRATQRYAISLSRDWILNAHHDLIGRDRHLVPRTIEISAGSWSGTTTDGSNEAELVADLTSHYNKRIEDAVNAITLTPAYIALVGGLMLGFVLMFGSFFVGLVVAAIGGAIFYWQYQTLDKRRDAARSTLETERDQALQILRACLAEAADYRREWHGEDSVAADLTSFLESLTSGQFILSGADKQRSALAS